MYYAMRASAPSLHRESTDSLIMAPRLPLMSWHTRLQLYGPGIIINDLQHRN